MKKTFTEWYNLEIMKQLDCGKNTKEMEVKLLLSKPEPLHASWLIELYNHFTSTAGKEIIANGWKAAGITDAIKNGLPLMIRSTLPLQLTLWNNRQMMKFSVHKEHILRNPPLIYKSDDEDESLKIPWPKIEIFLIFSMNKNLHLTSLFYVRQNCETILSIWNGLINFLTHFWKLRPKNIKKYPLIFEKFTFFRKIFLWSRFAKITSTKYAFQFQLAKISSANLAIFGPSICENFLRRKFLPLR